MNAAPVALFVYNRPLHTQKTIDALKRNASAASTKLFVFSDGARSAVSEGAVREVRAVIRQISGFRDVTIIERKCNLGLASSIIDGVTRLATEFGQVIVIEDDVIVAAGFLEYMNRALETYENEDRVMQLSGYTYRAQELEEDAMFLPIISSWGWATWSRAWRWFDPAASGYSRLEKDKTLRHRFDIYGHYKYFRMLHNQQRGKVESWAIRWYLSVFLRDGLVLYPRRTLVSNIGFDGSGINCGIRTRIQSELDPNFRVLKFPRKVEAYSGALDVYKAISIRSLSFVAALSRVKRRMNLG